MEFLKHKGIQIAVIGGLLAVATLVPYWQAGRHEFVNYDDGEYVLENVHVQQGLTLPNLRWAFTTLYFNNWHPLTWLSYMANAEFHGLEARGYILTNLFLHLANALLLLMLLHRATGHLWPSAMVAALFALHPLHVESVAWVSERKDVLSTFFGLAALWAYVLYGQNPRRLAYGATLILFALALMAKPMLVTLPLLMMLFDFWPLARVRVMLDEGRSWARSVPRLLYEKIPFFGLSAGCAALAWIAQSRGGAMRDWEVFPLTVRIAGACTSYLLYLVKTAYPIHLAVFYPHQGADIPVGLTVLSGTVLISATLWAFWGYRTRPHILMGWLWYLVSLLPVIGLVQVGGQAMADRYTYIPLIGIFIAIVWEIRRLKIPRLPRAVCLPSIAALLLVVLALLTYRQVGYWRDSEALFLRALDVIQDNLVAHKNLAQFYLVNEELDRAEHHSREALRLSPESAIARVNLGVVFGRRNQVDEALRLFREAYARDPHDPDVLYNLALGEFMARHFEEALVPVEELVSLRPHDQEAWQILAESVGNWKGVDEIVPHVESLFQQSPAPLDAMAAFGHVSLRLGNTQAARAQFERVLDEAPSHAVALKGLQRLN